MNACPSLLAAFLFQTIEDAFCNLSDGLPFVPRGGFDLPAPGNCRAFTGAALLFLTSNTLSGKIVCGWRFLKHLRLLRFMSPDYGSEIFSVAGKSCWIAKDV